MALYVGHDPEKETFRLSYLNEFWRRDNAVKDIVMTDRVIVSHYFDTANNIWVPICSDYLIFIQRSSQPMFRFSIGDNKDQSYDLAQTFWYERESTAINLYLPSQLVFRFGFYSSWECEFVDDVLNGILEKLSQESSQQVSSQPDKKGTDGVAPESSSQCS